MRVSAWPREEGQSQGEEVAEKEPLRQPQGLGTERLQSQEVLPSAPSHARRSRGSILDSSSSLASKRFVFLVSHLNGFLASASGRPLSCLDDRRASV